MAAAMADDLAPPPAMLTSATKAGGGPPLSSDPKDLFANLPIANNTKRAIAEVLK